MQGNCNNCFGLKKRNMILFQAKTNEHKYCNNNNNDNNNNNYIYIKKRQKITELNSEKKN